MEKTELQIELEVIAQKCLVALLANPQITNDRNQLTNRQKIDTVIDASWYYAEQIVLKSTEWAIQRRELEERQFQQDEEEFLDEL